MNQPFLNDENVKFSLDDDAHVTLSHKTAICLQFIKRKQNYEETEFLFETLRNFLLCNCEVLYTYVKNDISRFMFGEGRGVERVGEK